MFSCLMALYNESYQEFVRCICRVSYQVKPQSFILTSRWLVLYLVDVCGENSRPHEHNFRCGRPFFQPAILKAMEYFFCCTSPLQAMIGQKRPSPLFVHSDSQSDSQSAPLDTEDAWRGRVLWRWSILSLGALILPISPVQFYTENIPCRGVPRIFDGGCRDPPKKLTSRTSTRLS